MYIDQRTKETKIILTGPTLKKCHELFLVCEKMAKNFTGIQQKFGSAGGVSMEYSLVLSEKDGLDAEGYHILGEYLCEDLEK